MGTSFAARAQEDTMSARGDHANAVRQSFQTGGVINLAEGEESKDETLLVVPTDQQFDIRFVGVNGFAQPGQILFVALQVTTAGYLGIYPIVLTGTSPFSDPEFPTRHFGSQEVRLHADSGSDLLITVARHETHAGARVFVDVSGFLSRVTAASG
jgi:hypothetical protein